MAVDVSAMRELKPQDKRPRQLRRMPDGSEIWEWLERKRREQGISLDELASRLGCTRQGATNRLNGTMIMTQDRLRETAAAIGVDYVEPMPDPHPMNVRDVPEWLKRELKWQGFSQMDAAKHLHCDFSTLSAALNGKPMSLRVYTGLCDLLGAFPRLEEQFKAATKRTTKSKKAATAVNLPPEPVSAPETVIEQPPEPVGIDPEPVSAPEPVIEPPPEPVTAPEPVTTTKEREAAAVAYTVCKDGAPVGRFEEAQYAIMMVSALIVRKGMAEIAIRIEEEESA